MTEIPETPVEPDTGSPETSPTNKPTTSSYFKIARAVDGDDWWSTRLAIALEIEGRENTRSVRVAITKAVVEFIDCTELGDVSTERVTDEMIDDAIEALPVSTPET